MLQRIPKYPGKNISTNALRIRISPEPEKYALGSVFQNLRISAHQWKRKAKYLNFSPYSQISGVVFMIIIITFVIYLVSEVLIDRLSSDQIWR